MSSLRSAGTCITGVLKHAHIISAVGEPLDKMLILGSGNLKTVYICVCVCVCVGEWICLCHCGWVSNK
jgi:hypothetical protein